jgi:hypothetical protein
MMCGPFLEVFPTGEPGGFRLVGELDGSGAGPLWTFLEPVATCGLGLTLTFDEVRFMDTEGVDVIVRAVAANGGSAVIVRYVPRHVMRVFEDALPGGHPGLHFQHRRGDGPGAMSRRVYVSSRTVEQNAIAVRQCRRAMAATARAKALRASRAGARSVPATEPPGRSLACAAAA